MTNNWTYKPDADTLAVPIGNNDSFSHNQAIDVSNGFYDSEADNIFSCDRTRIRIHCLYRF